jgi:hypothetical protein
MATVNVKFCGEVFGQSEVNISTPCGKEIW